MASKVKAAGGKPASGTTKTTTSGGAAGKRPSALQQPLQPSKELAAVVGTNHLPRGEVVSKVWAYIKQHELQNPTSKEKLVLLGQRLGLGPESRVLDIASGRGGPALVLAETFGCSVRGVEISPWESNLWNIAQWRMEA